MLGASSTPDRSVSGPYQMFFIVIKALVVFVVCC